MHYNRLCGGDLSRGLVLNRICAASLALNIAPLWKPFAGCNANLQRSAGFAGQADTSRTQQTQSIFTIPQPFPTGYQRQLLYKHTDGSYSAFGEGSEPGNTW